MIILEGVIMNATKELMEKKCLEIGYVFVKVI